MTANNYIRTQGHNAGKENPFQPLWFFFDERDHEQVDAARVQMLAMRKQRMASGRFVRVVIYRPFHSLAVDGVIGSLSSSAFYEDEDVAVKAANIKPPPSLSANAPRVVGSLDQE